ncbi:GntR family transcriptional regulator [Phormidium tenue FACHB-886]|nr:GntR family transcriptional regulator [Phormidium tenue FACHB-886]
MPFPELIDNEEYSLTERVFNTLKQGILSLEIKPRDYLVIGDIAKEYGVSRTPVREALIMLEREGWVESDGRRGAKVTVPSAKVILEVIEVQAALEGYVVRRATPLLKDTDFQAMEALLIQADQAIANQEDDQARELGDAFHTYLFDIVGNRKLKAQIQQLQEHTDRIRPIIWHHAIVPVETSAQQHWDILQALKQRDVAKAEDLMFYHTIWYEKELASVLKNL